jgi:hypothetical protein
MTLILSLASSWFALQVSDRLVTQAGIPFDPIANKNILYIGLDGIISFGYTGLAYLDNIPTDQWLVEKMTGLFYTRGERTGTLRTGQLPRWPPIGRAVPALRDELNSLLACQAIHPLAPDTFFEVVGTGWHWRRRGRARPVLLGLVKKQASDHFELYYEARHIGRQCILSATPNAHADLLDREALLTRLRSIRSPDEAEGLLVESIRSVASQTNVVGRDCMSILLSPPRFGKARVRYVGIDAVAASIRSLDGPSTATPAAFSPWIVGAMIVHAPSILSGTFMLNSGAFKVTIEAPPPGSGSQGAMGSIVRPRAPR